MSLLSIPGPSPDHCWTYGTLIPQKGNGLVWIDLQQETTRAKWKNGSLAMVIVGDGCNQGVHINPSTLAGSLGQLIAWSYNKDILSSDNELPLPHKSSRMFYFADSPDSSMNCELGTLNYGLPDESL
jgi:hypothetical protein